MENSKVLTVTISMGIAMAHSGECTEHSLMKKADIALYEAKNYGKNSLEYLMIQQEC